MQVFVPDSDPLNVAMILWRDQRRYNKQIIECRQIISAIKGETKAWSNHPVVKMYKPHLKWLECYMNCLENFRNARNYANKHKGEGLNLNVKCDLATLRYARDANKCTPEFLTEDFCDQHRRRLYTKSPDLYSEYAPLGESYDNWYYVDGNLLKYRDGKCISSGPIYDSIRDRVKNEFDSISQILTAMVKFNDWKIDLSESESNKVMSLIYLSVHKAKMHIDGAYQLMLDLTDNKDT